MVNVHHSKRYCDECKKETLKDNRKRHYDKFKDENKHQIEIELMDNFKKVINQPFHLTGKGFNQVSKIKCKAYTQFLDMKWVDILKTYNTFDNLLEYVVSSYVDFKNETGKVNLHEFAKWNKYCTYDLLIDVGIDEIKSRSNIKKLRYTDYEFIDNFNSILNKLGKPPLYNEFEEFSKINLNTYAAKYKLKGKVYQKLMKIMLSEEQYKIYLSRYIEHKSNVGKETGILSAKYNDEDYKNNFHEVFNYCLKEFGNYPSRRLFNEFSKIDISAYRGKYEKSWLEVCEMYGYTVERNHKLEKMLLNTIESITNSKFNPQKTWDWLIGTGGKHMFCDGFFPSLNLVIEFDGVQHRKPIKAFGGEESFLRLQQNDELKEQLLLAHNIKLIRIASNTKWYDKEFIKDILVKNNIPIQTNAI